MASTTWNPSDKSGNHTLSSGNLVATHAINDNSYSTTRSIAKKPAGGGSKLYWEITYGTLLDAGNTALGIANSSAVLGTGAADATHWPGNDNNSLGYYPGILNGAVWVGGVAVHSLMDVFGSGDTVCVALDLANDDIWFRVGATGDWNGSPTANPASGSGGINTGDITGNIHALIGTYRATEVATANFGATAFVGTPPAGFVNLETILPLTAAQGTYTLTGKAATLIKSGGGVFILPANNGTYSLSGQIALLEYTPIVTAAFLSILDANRTSDGVLYSADYLTATTDIGVNGIFRNVFSTTSKNGGKYAFLVTLLNDIEDGTFGIGLGNNSARNGVADGANQWLGWDTNGVGVFSDGTVWFNNADTLDLGEPFVSTGDRVLFVIDMDIRKFWYRVNGAYWNNNANANPLTGVGGFSLRFTGNVFPALILGGNGSSMRITFLPSDPLPYSFLQWDFYRKTVPARNFVDMMGREPFTIIEIEQDLCSRIYGVAPCQAELGVTGTHKCYNTFPTCQDTNAYKPTDHLIMRFCYPASNLPRDINLFPTLMSISTSPAEINAGGGSRDSKPLGLRAGVTITLRDHPYHDRIVDPYWRERDFDPMTRGTFWSKWRARNKYYIGRKFRVYDGYIGESLSEMQVRHFVIERIEGPVNGVIRIIAKDPLKLTDADRAQAPTLDVAKPTTVVLADAEEFTIEAGHREEYSSSGTGRLGSELFSFIREGTDLIQMTERGVRDTEIAEHNTDEVFQEVLVYNDQRIDEVIRHLIITYTQIDNSYFNFAEWRAETDLWAPDLKVSAWIPEPTGVSDLLSELMEQCNVIIWWDERSQKIKFRIQHPVTDGDVVRQLTIDAHIVENSYRSEDKPDERISQVWYHSDVINPLASLEDPLNYKSRVIAIDEDAEGENEYNESRIKKIFSRWFGGLVSFGFGTSIEALCEGILARFRNTPVVIEIRVDAKDRDLDIGDIVDVFHPDIVDEVGLPTSIRMQIVSYEDFQPGHQIRLKLRSYNYD